MAFLTLNGWQVSVNGGEIEPREIGGMRRSQNGSMFKQRVAIKRRWRFTTTPMTFSDAQALMGLVLGNGYQFQFAPDTNPQEYDDDKACASDSGLIPSVDNESTVESIRAADGAPVATLVTAPSTYRSNDWIFSDGSVHCQDVTTNLLPANERDCENTPSTDFTNINSATLADETTHYWQGSKSLKITTTAGAVRGAATSYVVVSGSTEYVASVYLKGTVGGETIRLTIDENGGTDSFIDVTLPTANNWYRVWKKHTTSAGGPNTRMIVQDTNATDAQTWYCDGFQFEQKNHYTQWVDGVRAVAGRLSYPSAPFVDFASITIVGWVTGSVRPDGVGGYGFIYDTATAANGYNRILVYYNYVTNKIESLIIGSGGGGYLAANSAVKLDALWHHVAVVYDPTIPSLSLYEDGALAASSTTPSGSPPDFSLIDRVTVGSRYNYVNQLSANSLGQLLVLPYAAPSALITALAGRGTNLPRYPQIEAAGDFFDRTVNVMGRVSRSSYLGIQRTTWENNNLRVSFELEEV
jgi:hypothetical protein